MNQKKHKLTPKFYDEMIGDCQVINELIDCRVKEGIILTAFDKEIFPGLFASLKVDNATCKPVVLDLYGHC